MAAGAGWAWPEPVPCLTVMSQGKGLLGGAAAGPGITHNHNQPTLHAANMENIENLNHM